MIRMSLIRMIVSTEVWGWADQRTHMWLLPMVLGDRTLQMILDYELMPYFPFVLGVVLTVWYVLVMMVLVHVLRSRLLGMCVYTGLLVYAVLQPPVPSEIQGHVYVAPVMVLLMTFFYGLKGARGKEIRHQNPYYVEAPWLMAVDGTLLVSLVFITLGGVLLWASNGEHTVAAAYGVGVILLIMHKAPAVGSNSSALLVMFLTVAVIMMFTKFGEGFLGVVRDIFREIVVPPERVNPPVATGPGMLVMNMWKGFSLFGPRTTSGIYLLIRNVLGVIMQVAMVIDELLGPGVAIKAGLSYTLKEERKVGGAMGNFTSVWILASLVQLVVMMLYAGEMALFCNAIGGVLGVTYWILCMRPVWSGRGALSSWVKTNPGVMIATGSGPTGVRRLTAVALGAGCMLVRAVEFNSATLYWDISVMILTLVYKRLGVAALGWLSGNYSLIIIELLSRDPFAGDVDKYSMLGSNIDEVGGNSGLVDDYKFDEEKYCEVDFLDLGLLDMIGGWLKVGNVVSKEVEKEVIDWARKTKNKVIWKNKHGTEIIVNGENYWLIETCDE
uniref:Polyprotein n=1 Tax=Cryptocercus pudacuoensis jingmenvirus TaxID=3133548 RepID=A0AAT9JFN0_9FLAV